jgi:hypothetical protein
MTDMDEFIITSPADWKLIPNTTSLAIIARVAELLADIRDPETGEGATITQTRMPDGIKVLVRGSAPVRDEALRRISARRP